MNCARRFGFIQIVFLILAVLFPSSLITAQTKTELKVMTFNIRYGTADDGENSWPFRKDNLAETIKSFSPDILGLQEALQLQIDELIKQLPGYDYVGVGRDDGKSKGEHSCIFYSKKRFTVDSSNTFWFSETPDVIASKSWGNRITRICTWIRLKDKINGKAFYMFNLHIDHESQPSREKSAELLVKKISEKSLPVILTGDFNCGEENPAIKTILASGLNDSYRLLNSKREEEATYHAFKGDRTGEKIDFIFTSKDFNVTKSEIVRKDFNGKFPSDHFPLITVLKY